MERLKDRPSAFLGRPAPLGGLLLLALALFLPAAPLSGQDRRFVGIHVGETRSRQLWDGPISSRSARGFSLGVGVETSTPAPFLSIRLGLGYVRRGSEVWDDNLDPEGATPANVRSHYLSVPLQGKVRWMIGPGAVYLFGGPAVDQLLATGCTRDLCTVIREERPTVLSLTVGSGVSVDFGRAYRGELEIQLTEGLTGAYRSEAWDIRYRTVELLLRAGVPF